MLVYVPLCSLFILKSKSSNPIETHLADYQRCVEIFPQTQRTVTCETLMTDVQGRYLVLPCSYAATIAANTSMALPSAANGGAYAKSDPSFPFILSVYSQQPILIKRRPAFLPAITIAMQIATIRGQTKALSEVRALMHLCRMMVLGLSLRVHPPSDFLCAFFLMLCVF